MAAYGKEKGIHINVPLSPSSEIAMNPQVRASLE
jgi:hypothetical protein